MHTNFTPSEYAHFLAGKATAHATAFLDGRNDADQLARNARAVACEMIAAPDDPTANAMLIPARLLVVAMQAAASAQGEARQERWNLVMGAIVDLVKSECRAIKPGAVQEATHARPV